MSETLKNWPPETGHETYDRNSGPIPLDDAEIGLFEPSAHYDVHRYPDTTIVVDPSPLGAAIREAVDPNSKVK